MQIHHLFLFFFLLSALCLKLVLRTPGITLWYLSSSFMKWPNAICAYQQDLESSQQRQAEGAFISASATERPDRDGALWEWIIKRVLMPNLQVLCCPWCHWSPWKMQLHNHRNEGQARMALISKGSCPTAPHKAGLTSKPNPASKPPPVAQVLKQLELWGRDCPCAGLNTAALGRGETLVCQCLTLFRLWGESWSHTEKWNFLQLFHCWCLHSYCSV